MLIELADSPDGLPGVQAQQSVVFWRACIPIDHNPPLCAGRDVRIGVDARPLDVPSGIGRYTREILKHLIPGSGHDFFLYGTQSTDFAGENVRLRRLPVQTPRLSSPVAQAVFPQWITHDAVDVFWSPRHHLPLATHVPRVVTVHDLIWRKAPETMTGLGRTLERILMPPSVRAAQGIIVVSKSTRSDLLELSPECEPKVHIIAEAPFVAPSFADGEDPGSERAGILFVGTFEPRKNLERLLAAYRMLRDKGFTTHTLTLAGRPGWKLDVTKIVHSLNLQEVVRLVHPPGDRELAMLYRAADFVVMPSLYEGFGLPVVEAFSFGRPVVTSRISSLPEITGDGGILVDPHDTCEIAAAMALLIRDRQLYARLAKHGAAQVTSLSWEQAARETLGVIESAHCGKGS